MPDDDVISGPATLCDQDFCKYHNPEFNKSYISKWDIIPKIESKTIYLYLGAIDMFLGSYSHLAFPQSMTSMMEPPSAPSKRKNKELVREAFNNRILELRRTFNAKVEDIALEFTGKGPCYSRSQIRSQVIYNISAPKKTRKPMLPNAWAHAKAQADRKKSMWHCQYMCIKN